MVISKGDEEEGADHEEEHNGSKKVDLSSVAQDPAKQTEEDETELFLESNISKTLTEKTTKIVIILVLTLLFILPLF